jgi:rhodanese-related sulfurtransferase
LIQQLRASELARWRSDPERPAPVLVDVREPWEYEYCRIDGSLSMPLSELVRRYAEIPAAQPVVTVCHHGMRSMHAAAFLARAGFADVYNLFGGVAAWAAEVDPRMKTY